MSEFIEKSLKGMSLGVYVRHIILIGIVMALPMVMVISSNPPFYLYLYFIILTLLYPYARFAYESVFGYIIGNNIFLLPLPFMLMSKLFTMIFCWAFSIIVAPIGLICLYYYNSKFEKEAIEGLEGEKALYVEKKRAWEAEKVRISSGEQQ